MTNKKEMDALFAEMDMIQRNEYKYLAKYALSIGEYEIAAYYEGLAKEMN